MKLEALEPPTIFSNSVNYSQPQKILLVRFSSMGDIVFATTAVEAIVKKFPDCKIHFLTLDIYSPLLEAHPFLSRLILLRKGKNERKRLKSLAAALNLENYDLAFDLHDSLRSKYLRSSMKSVSWQVLRKPRWKRFFQFYFHYNLFTPHYDPVLNFLGNYEFTDDIFPVLYITHEEKLHTQELLIQSGVQERFVALVPSAAWDNKIWPVENYKTLVDQIFHEINRTVVILGGLKDEICRKISDGMNGIVNLQGKTDLRTALAILSLTDVAIGSDTGLLHAAEALGTPIILLSGPTGDYTGGKVRRKESFLLRSQQWCQPCSKSGIRPCYRKERYCLTGINTEKVWSSIKQTIAIS
ncbi:MAG: glycosyltransferase family 9 protein [Fidelibacterota bacterium]